MNYRIMRDDGKERALFGEGKIIPNEKGEPVQMLGTVQDVTLLKAAEMKLREDNAVLERRVLDRTKDQALTIIKLQEEIEKRERSEQEIKKLSFLISKTDNAILIAEKTGQISWVNEGFVRLSGYTLKDVIGTHGKYSGTESKQDYFRKIRSSAKCFLKSNQYLMNPATSGRMGRSTGH